jgi:hypothetical protein
MALTGKIDFRNSWFGGLMLLVEEDVKPLFGRKVKRRWRRATPMDLAQPELRILIDLRSRPHSGSRVLAMPLPADLAAAHRGSVLADLPDTKQERVGRLPH